MDVYFCLVKLCLLTWSSSSNFPLMAITNFFSTRHLGSKQSKESTWMSRLVQSNKVEAAAVNRERKYKVVMSLPQLA